MKTTSKTLISAALLSLFASGAIAASDELLGDDLVAAVSGKSFTCTAGGAPMTITFSRANAKGAVSYKGRWKGRDFASSYKLNRKGKYANNGKTRKFTRNAKGQLVISGGDVPHAYCK
ncbi:MAG: hypothetical protein ACRBBV_02795 [Paracoccaceae bacterium]